MGWNDLPQSAGPGQSSEGQIPFLKITTEVTLRILSDPEIYMKHFTFTVSGKQTVVRCPGRESCLICHREGKPKVRAMFVVLDKVDGNVKLYDAPQTVAAQIKSLMGVWGPLTGYDLLIKKLGNTKRTDYQVIALPATPLTQPELDKIRTLTQNFNLKNSTRPHTPEEVNAIITEQPLPSRQGNAQFQQPQQPAPMQYQQPAPAQPVQPQPQQQWVSHPVGPVAPPPAAPTYIIPPAAPVSSPVPIPAVGPVPAAPVMPQPVGPQTGVQTFGGPTAPPGGYIPPQPGTPNVANAADASYFNNFLK